MTPFRRVSLVFLALLALCSSSYAAELTVFKAKRLLRFTEGTTERKFRVGLGSCPIGAKERQGDRRTPEGEYFVSHKNPKSQFLRSLGLSYPNLNDAARGLVSGLISKREFKRIEKALTLRRLPPQDTALGGDIFIHGSGSASDWTWGCIALDDADIRFLYEHVSVGSRVVIVP